MSIFIDKNTTLVVQGITGRDGSFHTKQMMEYGTKVVAGVTPGKGGQKFENTVPIFNTVADAVAATGAAMIATKSAEPTAEGIENGIWDLKRSQSACIRGARADVTTA